MLQNPSPLVVPWFGPPFPLGMDLVPCALSLPLPPLDRATGHTAPQRPDIACPGKCNFPETLHSNWKPARLVEIVYDVGKANGGEELE